MIDYNLSEVFEEMCSTTEAILNIALNKTPAKSPSSDQAVAPAVHHKGEVNRLFRSLIGDVGGTNTRLQIIQFKSNDSSFTILAQATYKVEEYKFESFEANLEFFLKTVDASIWPEMAHIGMAGVVYQNINHKISNRPNWPATVGEQIGKKFNIPNFRLYNDFEITSYGILRLDPKQLIQLNNAERADNQPMVVCGAGTGLGVSFLAPFKWSNGEYRYQVFPTESGHSGFSQTREELTDYYNFLKTKQPEKGDYIGQEYAFAGPAIPIIYEFVKLRYPKIREEGGINIETDINLDASLFSGNSKHFPSQEVTRYGTSKQDRLCQKVVDLLVEMYMGSLGDLSLRFLPYSGIFVTGQLTEAVTDYILEQKDSFLAEYRRSKSYLEFVFQRVPIYVVKGEIGLSGAVFGSLMKVKKKTQKIIFSIERPLNTK